MNLSFKMPTFLIAMLLVGTLTPSQAPAQPPEHTFPLDGKRILFLGDSITNAGEYVTLIETQMRLQGVDPLPEFVNIGLSSETCSGLSEPSHPFPRPDVHTRLDQALAKVRPDVVVACYGMNDGIYYPFGEDRFKAYQDGVRKLIAKSRAAGARVVFVTPPPFDRVPLEGTGKLKAAGADEYSWAAAYEDYDSVLTRYARWIMEEPELADMVIDVHTPLTDLLAETRTQNPDYVMAPDGVHPNSEGHRALAETILRAWGIESWQDIDPELQKLMIQRDRMLHDAWLSDVGHERPGVKAGLPLAEATAKAQELQPAIDALVAKSRQPKTSTRQSTGGTIYHVHYPATARPGKLRLSADYDIWIPEQVPVLRGVIVHQHGCGPGASIGGQTAADDLHWQALARKWNCALMGSSYEPKRGVNCRLWCDARNGSDDQFQLALRHFAQVSEHTELDTLPWCLWGHSGGAFWASLMQTRHPERIVAIWLRSGTAFGYWTNGEIPVPEMYEFVYGVPVMGNPGFKEKDDPRFHVAWDGLKAMQTAYREAGAPFFEFAPDPRTAHECGDSRYLAIPFFDFWLEHRLRPLGDSNPNLRPTVESVDAWSASMAARQSEYIREGSVSDTTAPPPPASVTVTRRADGTAVIRWTANADFESGIRAFIIERDGRKIAQVPENPVGRFGRPLFQQMSYHDTPEQPLPKMEYLDTAAPADPTTSWAVRTVNSVELQSDPTEGRIDSTGR